METVQKAKVRLEKDVRGNKKNAQKQLEVVQKINTNLEAGKLANETPLDLEDEDVQIIVREMSLLTMKPFLFIYNVADINQKLSDNLESRKHVKLDIKIEEELIEMTKEEAQELDIESNIDELIITAYSLLGLITYFTTGVEETRAWTIKKGWNAPMAGTAIHNDFKDKFIRAEIIQWDKLLEAGSWGKARELGTLRTEGKEYIMQDGDVVEFKI